MSIGAYTPLLLVIVLVVAVLGMPLLLASPTHHEIGCPFLSGQAALCASNVLEHVRHWQTAFAAIFAEMLSIAALTLLVALQWGGGALPERSFARIRMRARVPARPTLLQELFSQGILNRKEQYRS